MKLKQAILTTLLVMGCASMAQATVFSGRVGLSSYLWKYREADSSDTRHLQNAGTVSLRVGRIGNQDLEILTSMLGRYNVRNAGDNVHDYRVYDLQARWKDRAKRVDLAGGRHRVYWPNGTVSIDGGSAAIHPGYGLQAGGYFGLLAPDDGRFKMTEYDKGHAFGAQLGYHSGAIGDVAFSFAQKNRARSYIFSDTAIAVNNLDSRTLGLDWRRTINRIGSVYGQALYQLPQQRIGRVHLSARWHATEALSLNGQFRYRRPDLPYNSIFWVFGESRYYEGRLRADYRINPVWSVNAGGTYVNLSDGSSQRFDVGVGHKYFSLTLFGRTGWPGSTIGVSGDATYPINDRWTLRGGTHLSSYELIEDTPETSTEGSAWAGGTWRWIPQSSLDVEVQYVSQLIKNEEGYVAGRKDLRLILRASWWFFRRVGAVAG